MPSCRGVTYWSSLKDDQPILLLGKSHLQRGNAVGWILPLFRTRTKLSKTSSKPWASSSLAGRSRPVDYEWFLTRASAASRARLRAQGWLPGAAGKEGTILPAGNQPGGPGSSGQCQDLSLCTQLRWKEGRWCRLVSPLQWKQKPTYFIKPQRVVFWWFVTFPIESSFKTGWSVQNLVWIDTSSASPTSFPKRGEQWHVTQHKTTLLLGSSEIKLWGGGQNLEHCW